MTGVKRVPGQMGAERGAAFSSLRSKGAIRQMAVDRPGKNHGWGIDWSFLWQKVNIVGTASAPAENVLQTVWLREKFAATYWMIRSSAASSTRGVWPPRNTLFPSNNVRWSTGCGLSQSDSVNCPLCE